MNKKITDLTPITTLALEDIFPVIDVSVVQNSLKNKSATIQQIIELANNTDLGYKTNTGVAGEAITAGRAVMIKGGLVFHYDPTDETNYGLFVGISNAAYALDATVTYIYAGKFTTTGITENEIYYANSDGAITTVTPAEGVYQEIGFGVNTTTFYVHIGQPELVANMNGNTAFDGARAIKRIPVKGDVPGGSTIADFLENTFYPYLNATITLDPFPLQIVGVSYAPDVNGIITPEDDTITARRVMQDDVSINSPGGNVIDYTAPSFTVVFGDNKTYKIEADVSNDGDPTTVESPEETVEGIYPYLWGASSDPNLTGSALYTNLNKLVEKEGTKLVTFNGTNQYFYFGFDAAFGDLSEIKDQNGFPLGGMLASLSAESVTALGWTHGYKFYRTELTTINNGTYQFIT